MSELPSSDLALSSLGSSIARPTRAVGADRFRQRFVRDLQQIAASLLASSDFPALGRLQSDWVLDFGMGSKRKKGGEAARCRRNLLSRIDSLRNGALG
jgi:hypothetical protein